MPTITTRAAKVKNPFKEHNKNLWIHYTLLIATALGLTVLVIYYSHHEHPLPLSSVISSGHGGGDAPYNNKNHKNHHDNKREDRTDPKSNSIQHPKNNNMNIVVSKEEWKQAQKDGPGAKKQKQQQQQQQKKKNNNIAFPQHMSQNDFELWLHDYYQELKWTTDDVALIVPQFADDEKDEQDEQEENEIKTLRLMNRDILSKSLQLGCQNIVENQNEAGNFNYQYDFVKQELDRSDSAVRQAGALWGIALCYQYDPSNVQYKSAVEKGIQFFINHSVSSGGGGRSVGGDAFSSDGKALAVRYPDKDAPDSATGVNALFGLGMIEYLRTIAKSDGAAAAAAAAGFPNQVRTTLDGILRHLQSMQLPNKHFADAYYFGTGKTSERSSPYYDGETMLCLVKAAKYIPGYAPITPLLERTTPILAKAYSIDVWGAITDDDDDGDDDAAQRQQQQKHFDSDQTKGFYQWGSMFMTEYFEAGWSDTELCGDFVMVLGHWILYTHNVLHRQKNTGYAFEGIISAYEIAKYRDDEEAIKVLELAIDQGLHKLTTWQVGGPLSQKNEFLVQNPTLEKIAIGGIMNAKDEAPLRIDTTQHQMHALMMALTSVYIK